MKAASIICERSVPKDTELPEEGSGGKMTRLVERRRIFKRTMKVEVSASCGKASELA